MNNETIRQDNDMESKILSGTHTWEEAIEAQGNGWRLPNIFGLIDLCKENTKETIQVCWSASPYAGTAPGSWVVYFGSGFDGAYAKSLNYCVRLVRGKPVECKPVCRRELVAYRLKQQNTKENNMKLEVGKKYETKNGAVYEVVRIIDDKLGARYPAVALEKGQCAVETFTLEGVYDTGVCARGISNLVREHIEPPLLYCGYSKDQWQFIIDGNFLCGFTNSMPQEAPVIQTLSRLIPIEGGYKFMAHGDTTWSNCSPVRQAGIRQPWFGGEQPVSNETEVIVKLQDGRTIANRACELEWEHDLHDGADEDVVEFVYLETSDA